MANDKLQVEMIPDSALLMSLIKEIFYFYLNCRKVPLFYIDEVFLLG